MGKYEDAVEYLLFATSAKTDIAEVSFVLISSTYCALGDYKNAVIYLEKF
ncbi:MAG: hypothetical protein J7L07_04405 [Candidatus Odinarchaeota archaeon]|nr:hypothetical protein [Candidatus Odinarchaeota archaeon]